jgi:hypothetical protein
MLVVTASAAGNLLLRDAAERTGSKHLDFLSLASSGQTPVTVGAFMRHHLVAWLKERARETGGIWVDNADTIIVTWPDDERRAFFMEFLRTESRRDDGSAAPIVLVSALAGRFALPEEPRGQGIVVRI